MSAKLKSHNIDIVHSNSFATLYGAVLAVENGLPHVWHIREFMESDHKIEHFNKGKAQRLAQASSAIFISPAVEKAYNGRFTFKTTTTILDKVSRDSKYHKSRQFMEDGVCRLLMVGALSPEKGQLDAIQAVQELEQKGYNVRLTLCGSGDVSYIAPYLQTKNVRYLGQQDDLTMIRQQSDIALVCSRNEAFGRVSIEAMYYGNVLIGADAGFTKELIKEGKNGFLYRVGSPSNLAEKVEFLMKNPEEADSVGEYASAVSTVFAKPIFPQIADYYKRVVEGAQGKPREY
ncbi:hypothetical protein KIMH_15180 [Bombiscardovia apis]|uniref:Glycosyl transferase family 1 domain-containing protein n=1 Tax=Bombiscardovia apis TaxID=2932182 RepID=A0ABM8BEP3_9BIFI|nr:hypothetical protein KIMH_15180 [Bombiscardovia apis]